LLSNQKSKADTRANRNNSINNSCFKKMREKTKRIKLMSVLGRITKILNVNLVSLMREVIIFL
jgi:hypothetical protein